MIIATHRHRFISWTSQRARFLEVPETIEDEHDDARSYRMFLQSCRCKLGLFRVIPFTYWIRRYPWRVFFPRDIISGLTVSVLLVTQGLAYAQLADCPPVVGLYMATFPGFIYAILSSAKHVNYGPMALICLMTDGIITPLKEEEVYKHLPSIEIGIVVAFTVGLWLILMFILRLGFICSLLSKTFISSFTAGVAVHVITSQMKELLGIELKKHFGVLGIVYSYKEMTERLLETNLVACGIGMLTLALLLIYEALLRPLLFKRGIILPMEFFLMVIAGVISYIINLEDKHSVRVVGVIPKGFPSPTVPQMDLISEVVYQSLIVAIVSYFITESIALFYAGLKKYHVDSQQELLAQGVATLFASFLSCLPLAGSLSRSTVHERVGGETQMASIVAVCFMVLVLFFIGDFLYPIPRSALAGIIVSSFSSIFHKAIIDLRLLWIISRQEFLLWFMTFLIVVFVRIDIGLACGLFISLLINIIHSSDPQVCLIGRVSASDNDYVYIQLKQEIGSEVPGVKIIQINGPVNFITRDHIQSRIYQLSGVDPSEIIKSEELFVNNGPSSDRDPTLVPFKIGNPVPENCNVAAIAMEKLQFIVLDVRFSTKVDWAGVQCLEALARAFDAAGVGVALVAHDRVLSPLRHVSHVVRQLEAQLQLRMLLSDR